MRLHTDKITTEDVYAAARAADSPEDGRVFVSLSEHGSRKRAHAFEVGLEGDGTKNRRRRNPGTGDRSRQAEYAATWDAWGRFFAHLYKIDPEMVAGSAYTDADDFHSKTRHAFA